MIRAGYGNHEDDKGLHDCVEDLLVCEKDGLGINLLLCTIVHHGPFSYKLFPWGTDVKSEATSRADCTHVSATDRSSELKSSVPASVHRSTRRSDGRVVKIFSR